MNVEYLHSGLFEEYEKEREIEGEQERGNSVLPYAELVTEVTGR